MHDRIAHFVNGQWTLGEETQDPASFGDTVMTILGSRLVKDAAIAVGIIVVAFILIKIMRWASAVVYIRNDEVGVLERKWSRKGSVKSGFLALNGEAGFVPEVLRGGIHFLAPFVYTVHRSSLVTIPQGTIGYVFARGGVPLAPGQTLATARGIEGFDDARAFLNAGGQRGPQRAVLREGVHAVNTAQFVVFGRDADYGIDLDDKSEVSAMSDSLKSRQGFDPVVVRDGADTVGVVTVHDGPALEAGDIIAPLVEGHSSFQDPEAFLKAGGLRGRQLQVLVEGTWYINRLFATVEMKPKTAVQVGFAGVVVSYVGERGTDISGAEFRHGELVDVGQRGVWSKPLNPGKYALNPYAMEVRHVPVTNFVLRWIAGRTESHELDDNLAEIRLITKDAFEPILPLSVVVHIDYQKAPRVVQRFADLKLLVEQTLDPMVSAYFRDAAQGSTLIELIQKRAELQVKAKEDMGRRFCDYDLDLREVMIGTPQPAGMNDPMATVLDQLRQRQVAAEQVQTFKSQAMAAEEMKKLTEAKAAAEAQAQLTKTKIGIEVADNEGKAKLALATREAEGVKISAQAEAERIKATGTAEADAIRVQVEASGGAEYQLRRVVAEELSKALRDTHVPLVPTVQSGDGAQGGNLMQSMLSLVMANHLERHPNGN